jgi:hypothetical protein
MLGLCHVYSPATNSRLTVQVLHFPLKLKSLSFNYQFTHPSYASRSHSRHRWRVSERPHLRPRLLALLPQEVTAEFWPQLRYYLFPLHSLVTN